MKKFLLGMLLWAMTYYAAKTVLLSIGIEHFGAGFLTGFLCCFANDVFHAFYRK